MSIVLNTLKRTLQNTKANVINLNAEVAEALGVVEAKKKQLAEAFAQVQELESAITKLEKPDASKNKKTKG